MDAPKVRMARAERERAAIQKALDEVAAEDAYLVWAGASPTVNGAHRAWANLPPDVRAGWIAVGTLICLRVKEATDQARTAYSPTYQDR